MKTPSLSFRPVADTALLIETPRALAVFRRLHQLADARVRNLHPAYTSVLVEFDPLKTDASEMQAALEPLARAAEADAIEAGRLVEIPVRYGGDDGPDLAAVAQHHGISPEEVVRRHSGVEYQVAFLGFQPGFPYLLGLPKELATPRLETPRLRVPAGSVGIAGDQTGIYPLASPGGWQLIGRARVELFQPHHPSPTLLLPGDRVRFVPEGA